MKKTILQVQIRGKKGQQSKRGRSLLKYERPAIDGIVVQRNYPSYPTFQYVNGCKKRIHRNWKCTSAYLMLLNRVLLPHTAYCGVRHQCPFCLAKGIGHISTTSEMQKTTLSTMSSSHRRSTSSITFHGFTVTNKQQRARMSSERNILSEGIFLPGLSAE